MKRSLCILVVLMCSLAIHAQDILGFVNKQLETYPKSRLLDLYKSCFQDYMGAEHLVSDRQRVKAYLDEEIQATTPNELMRHILDVPRQLLSTWLLQWPHHHPQRIQDILFSFCQCAIRQHAL